MRGWNRERVKGWNGKMAERCEGETVDGGGCDHSRRTCARKPAEKRNAHIWGRLGRTAAHIWDASTVAAVKTLSRPVRRALVAGWRSLQEDD